MKDIDVVSKLTDEVAELRKKFWGGNEEVYKLLGSTMGKLITVKRMLSSVGE